MQRQLATSVEDSALGNSRENLATEGDSEEVSESTENTACLLYTDFFDNFCIKPIYLHGIFFDLFRVN